MLIVLVKHKVMKANEMPEKIYLFDYNDAMVTPIEGDTAYVREDAFIEKAATWIANRYQANGSYLNAGDIEDFEKHMKGE